MHSLMSNQRSPGNAHGTLHGSQSHFDRRKMPSPKNISAAATISAVKQRAPMPSSRTTGLDLRTRKRLHAPRARAPGLPGCYANKKGPRAARRCERASARRARGHVPSPSRRRHLSLPLSILPPSLPPPAVRSFQTFPFDVPGPSASVPLPGSTLPNYHT